MSLNRRLLRAASLGASLACACAFATSAATAGGNSPGSSPTNPITQIGVAPNSPGVADVIWPDGTHESLSLGMIASNTRGQALLDIAAPVVAAHAKAEGRTFRVSSSSRRLQGTRRTSDEQGPYYCSVVLYYPSKVSSSAVATNAGVACSGNVENEYGWLYLYRGAGFTLIGTDYAAGSPLGVGWYTQGSCASSTWQYNAVLDYTMDTPAGDYDFDHAAGPSWISC